MAAPTLVHEMQRLAIDPMFREGEELEQWVQDRTRSLAQMVFDPGITLPTFPFYTGMLVAGLGLALVLFRGGQRAGGATPNPADARGRAALGCSLVVLAYVVVLAWEILPYAVVTTAMVFTVGGVIAGWRRRSLPVLAELAVLTGFGTELLFTRVFSLVLP
jgi:hypothetical protein